MNQLKVFRLLQLINFLFETDGIRVHTLAQYLNITERSVYRYINLLEEAGFEVERTTSGRLKIHDGTFNRKFTHYLKTTLRNDKAKHKRLA